MVISSWENRRLYKMGIPTGQNIGRDIENVRQLDQEVETVSNVINNGDPKTTDSL